MEELCGKVRGLKVVIDNVLTTILQNLTPQQEHVGDRVVGFLHDWVWKSLRDKDSTSHVVVVGFLGLLLIILKTQVVDITGKHVMGSGIILKILKVFLKSGFVLYLIVSQGNIIGTMFFQVRAVFTSVFP